METYWILRFFLITTDAGVPAACPISKTLSRKRLAPFTVFETEIFFQLKSKRDDFTVPNHLKE